MCVSQGSHLTDLDSHNTSQRLEGFLCPSNALYIERGTEKESSHS